MDRKISRPDVDEGLDMESYAAPRTHSAGDNSGQRAPAWGSGVVTGSGAGAGGGGNPEDFDTDSAGGAGRHLSPTGPKGSDLSGQAPLTRDEDPLLDLSRVENDAEETSDAGRPTTDHDPKGWRADPASKP